MSVDVVVKLGGSLEAAGIAPAVLAALGSPAAQGRRLLLVPGGGRYADAVRRAARACEAGPDASHWAAIRAMDRLARRLVRWLPVASLVTSREQAADAVRAGRVALLAPFAWLRSEDPLPHSWDVTGDSIAAWVAGRLDVRRLVLLKMVAAPVSDAALLARLGIVDAWFPRALPPGMPWTVVDAHDPASLGAAVAGSRMAAEQG